MRKVAGERNLADHLTKIKNIDDMEAKMAEAGGKMTRRIKDEKFGMKKGYQVKEWDET